MTQHFVGGVAPWPGSKERRKTRGLRVGGWGDGITCDPSVKEAETGGPQIQSHT